MRDGITFAFAIIGVITVLWVVCAVWVKLLWPFLYLHVFRKSPAMPLRITRLGYTLEQMRKAGWEMNLYGIGGKRWGIGVLFGSPPVWTCETRSCRQEFKSKAEVIAHEKEMKHGDFAGTP